MKRIPIRDTKSENRPRLFDIIIEDDGTTEIEVKNKTGKHRILYEEMQKQMTENMTPEPR